jgi:hypothetical protein
MGSVAYKCQLMLKHTQDIAMWLLYASNQTYGCTSDIPKEAYRSPPFEIIVSQFHPSPVLNTYLPKIHHNAITSLSSRYSK